MINSFFLRTEFYKSLCLSHFSGRFVGLLIIRGRINLHTTMICNLLSDFLFLQENLARRSSQVSLQAGRTRMSSWFSKTEANIHTPKKRQCILQSTVSNRYFREQSTVSNRYFRVQSTVYNIYFRVSNKYFKSPFYTLRVKFSVSFICQSSIYSVQYILQSPIYSV